MNAPKNIFSPIKKVKLSELELYTSDSIFKRVCPDCGGILPISRDRVTLKLIRTDRCLLCGQAYEYSDFDTWEYKNA